MKSQRNTRTGVFISYCHQDTDWLDRLRVHLRPLERDYNIHLWDDTRISPGSNWREEIRKAIASCKVAILLISADFLASDFITTNELPPILKAASEEGAVILPVILSPSRFLRTESLSHFQSVNSPSKPLINLVRGEQEAVLDKVAQSVETILESASNAALQPSATGNDATTGEERLNRVNAPINVNDESVNENKEPIFLAEFVRNSKGALRRRGKSFEIRLFIRNAPQGTHKVVYELDESYTNRIRTALRGRREFEEYIISYGDYQVNIAIHGKNITELNDWLSSALQNNYVDSTDEEVFKAIEYIEDH